MTAVIRGVLADDQPLVRAGLRMILRGEDDIRFWVDGVCSLPRRGSLEVVGEAADGADAVVSVPTRSRTWS